MSTRTAALARWIPLVYFDERPPIPGGFVLQLAHKLTPSDITDGLCQSVVLHHMLDLKTLDADRLVLTNDASRKLVLIVTASISNARMHARDLVPGFGTVLGPLFLLGQATLGTRQLLFILVEELGIANGLPRREDHHGLQAQVQSHLLVHLRQGLDVLFHQDGDKVAVGRVFGDGHGPGLRAWWQWAAPVDSEGRLHLGKREVLAIPLESRCSIGCGLLSLLFLEGGILGASCKEIAKGAIQMTQGLLERHAGDLIQPRGLLFEES